MKVISYTLFLMLFAVGATFSVIAEQTKFVLKCDKWGDLDISGHKIKGCVSWSLCPEGSVSAGCATWGPLSLYAQDELREYMMRNNAEIQKRKAAGKVYVECLEKEGSGRCKLGYIVKQCSAPKGGQCSVILESFGNTAVCHAADGASCTSKMRLRLENVDQFREQMKIAKG